ncbi:MAG: PhnD/SsuA/transferrin family substrate-binding protein [Betaproteobacteria bacterium]|nr:PhnD/SsuA/transferrin family substrate-binding protein [Betaproteobacteria bacterium]
MKRILGIAVFLAVSIGGTLPAFGNSLLLGVNEGVAQQSAYYRIQSRYKGFAAYLSSVLKEPVRVESSQSISIASSDVREKRYDLMFCRPSNVAAHAMRDEHYQLVAMAKGQFVVSFIVPATSRLKKPGDIEGTRIAMPDRNTMIAQVALATLRDMRINPATQNILYAHYQAALPYIIKNHFADVAAVGPFPARKWLKSGGRVLFKAKPLPFWSVLASPSLPAADVQKLREALLKLNDSDVGRKILARMKVASFVPGNEQAYLNMLKWMDQ